MANKMKYRTNSGETNNKKSNCLQNQGKEPEI